MPMFVNQQMKTALELLPISNAFFPFAQHSPSKGKDKSHEIIAENDAATFQMKKHSG